MEKETTDRQEKSGLTGLIVGATALLTFATAGAYTVFQYIADPALYQVLSQ